MSVITRFLSSSIGRKVLMALTGLLLLGFLITHMAGNLLALKSAHTYNAYSHSLVSNPLIYIAEMGLLGLFVAHFVSGILITRRNRAARPVAYEVKRPAGHTSHKTMASSTMIITGLVVLAFVPLHLYTFKFGPHYTSAADPEMRDLYRLVVEVFHDPLHLVWYLFAMAVIGFHLWHGFGSGLESLGVKYRTPLRHLGQALAVLIAGGFILMPIVIFLTGGQQ